MGSTGGPRSAEVAKLQQLSIYLCHPESGSDPLAASADVNQATLGAPEN